MTSHGIDHWSTSLDAVEVLRARMDEVAAPENDAVTRQLMAQVAHAKSSSFMVLLDRRGHVLDVNPAALIAGGLDRAEVIGLPLWRTAWWSNADSDAIATVEQSVRDAGMGRFTRF